MLHLWVGCLVLQSGGHHVEPEPEFREAGCVVDVFVDHTEATQLIEATCLGVGFEDVEFEVCAGSCDVIHEGTSDASALILGGNENSTDLVSDHRHGADKAPICLEHRRF